MKTLLNCEEIPVRAMSKKELAVAYAPELTIKGATNRLGRWMRYNAHLMAELEEAGYRTSQRIMTSRQVGIVFKYLGRP